MEFFFGRPLGFVGASCPPFSTWSNEMNHQDQCETSFREGWNSALASKVNPWSPFQPAFMERVHPFSHGNRMKCKRHQQGHSELWRSLCQFLQEAQEQPRHAVLITMDRRFSSFPECLLYSKPKSWNETPLIWVRGGSQQARSDPVFNPLSLHTITAAIRHFQRSVSKLIPDLSGSNFCSCHTHWEIRSRTASPLPDQNT